MKTQLYDTAICRTPVFPLTASLEEVWDELKNYIRYASPSFYELIKDHSYHESETLSDKIRFTVWKYFNRAKFRATPFGHFGAFIPVPVKSASHFLKFSKKLIVHEFSDWTEVGNEIDFSKITNFRSNTSIYQIGDDLRYLKSNKATFKLSSIEYHELAYTLVQFCNTSRSREEVYDFLETQGINTKISDAFLEQLVELQLLVSDQHPNIIGNDYFKRLTLATSSGNRYIISERRLLEGNLYSPALKPLNRLIKLLSYCIPPQQQPDLDSFRKRFYNRFENRTIPLLLALDPEKGIGYGDLEQEISDGNITDKLSASNYGESAESHFVNLNYNRLTRFILEKIFSGKPIDLSEMEIDETSKAYPLPASFFAQIELIDDIMLVKSLGGTSATSLLGRFTLASEQVAEAARELAKAEEVYNPDILFFDIAYQSEKNVDNVNRRSQIYDFEMPIVGWSESENIIDLNDIYVTVKGDEVVLFSQKYAKRIIPRHVSAYNVVRSDLSVFRFLTDLQHQNLSINLSVDLKQLFPGLDYYPRVSFKNTILSTKKWLLPERFSKQSKKKTSDLIAELKQWLKEYGISTSFKCGIEDQTLTFTVQSDTELNMFLMYTKNKDKLYIEEALISQQTRIIDEQEQPYSAEFLLSFVNQKQVYKHYAPSMNLTVTTSVKEKVLPGDGWLYYEIYCHSSRSNDLLTGALKPLLFENKKYIKKWFFIRYNDPTDHIRFRIQFKDEAQITSFMLRFNETMAPWLETATISDIQLKTYKREIERYGHARMYESEKFFHIDSDLAVMLISKKYPVSHLHYFSIQLIKDLLVRSTLSAEQQLDFVQKVADSFSVEKKIDNKGFKMINESYRKLMDERNSYRETKTIHSKKEKLLKLALDLLSNCRDDEKSDFLSSLIHMHINRLFSKDTRMHELVVYQFLFKLLRSEMSQKKHSSKQLTV